MNILIRDIQEIKKQLEELENQYTRETERCHNKKCAWYSDNASLNCRWTVLVETCRDYKDEED